MKKTWPNKTTRRREREREREVEETSGGVRM